jgi:hypothetical protein
MGFLAALLLVAGLVVMFPGLCTLYFTRNFSFFLDPNALWFTLLLLASLGGGTALIWIAIRILTR